MSERSLCKESVFSEIFMSYSETLHHFLYYKCGDDALAQDLTQEAFTRLWLNCKTVDHDKAKDYVFKTANNLLLNTYEHKKVVLKFTRTLGKDRTNQNPQFLLEEKEMQERLDTAISTLPEKQRVAFLLSRIDKKTYKEIATLLGISKQAVEKRIYNALDSLRLISEKIK